MTRKKIISLVEGELKYDYQSFCDRRRDRERMEKDWLVKLENTVMRFFGHGDKTEVDIDSYYLYEQFKTEDVSKKYESHLEYLQARFGVDATLKGKDWERVIEAEKDAEKAYSELHQSLPHLAEQLNSALQCFKEILDRKEVIASPSGSDLLLYLYGRICNLHKGYIGVVMHAGHNYTHYSDGETIDRVIQLDFDSKEMRDRLQNFRDISFEKTEEYEQLKQGYFAK